MHVIRLITSSWLAIALVTALVVPFANDLERRQTSIDSAFPTLGSSAAPSTSATASGANTQSTQSPSVTGSSSASGSGATASPTSTLVVSTTSRANASNSSSTSITTSSTPTASSTPNNGTTAADDKPNVLPLQPRITPALSVGGVILILTGMVYALIGIKNRWMHIFLSTAYLTSVSICVLILYVMNPPVSNAIQGAYFVGILMTGIIFGGGALIFKEVTEGLGCLLGGFTLSMWFLTLKDGGLITNSAGKAIFITVFCILAWSLSFSHYTRAYGLIGATSFSGATAFILGIDCFSRGGLKEFWLYIWGLNPNLFPLNTDTYPITRGTRVETVVIILACIIGVISQLKVWKVVKDRQKKREAANQEEERRREAVEAALGKHLERRNDRDRTEWERQYGDRLNAKRETILWTDTVGEKKRYSRISEAELGDNRRSSSSESLEMGHMPKKPRSVYVGKIKRQSSMAVQAIPELEENDQSEKYGEQQKSLEKLEGIRGDDQITTLPATSIPGLRGVESKEALQSNKSNRDSRTTSSSNYQRDQSPAGHSKPATDEQQYLATPDENKKKRLSWSSVFSKSPKEGGTSPKITQSQEALVVPEAYLHHSRASSLAATLDSENDVMDLPNSDMRTTEARKPPQIIVSPVEKSNTELRRQNEGQAYRTAEVPPSPPALVEHFDIDPEEFVRAPVEETAPVEEIQHVASGRDSVRQRSGPVSEVGDDVAHDLGHESGTITSDGSASEILTKGALDQVPSHLSNVVMSYRTNEWAKHIAIAEAPVYEEPQSMLDEDGEKPAHLAIPEELEAQAVVAEPPPLSLTTVPSGSHSPVEAAIPSPTAGIRVNPAVQPKRQSSTSTTATAPAGLPASHGKRSSSTPLLNQTGQTSPADGITTIAYNPRQSVVRSASVQSYNQIANHDLARSRTPTLTGLYPYGNANGTQSALRLSMVSEQHVQPERSVSQMGSHRPMIPTRSETRLQSYNSHQPTRRDTNGETQRREAMLADWRLSQQKPSGPSDTAEGHRMQMVMQRQQAKAMEEHEKNIKLQQEMAKDTMMRSRDMQELHREAMRKLQANANKNLHSTGQL